MESCQVNRTLVIFCFLLVAWKIPRTNSNNRTSSAVHSGLGNCLSLLLVSLKS